MPIHNKNKSHSDMNAFAGFSPRVLFIDSNEHVADKLLANFEKDGYIVRWTPVNPEIFGIIAEFLPNLIILNWKSIGSGALELCQNIRANPNYNDIRIIIISHEFQENDAIRVLTMGADDYLVHPISDSLLLARAWSHLRPLRNKNLFSSGRKVIHRANPINPLKKQLSSRKTIKHNNITINFETMEVKRHGMPIQLREAEFRLLILLIENPKKIFTRNELIYNLWEQPDKIDFRTVDVMIGRLRKALSLPNRTDAIRSIRGFGYGLSLEDHLIKG